MSMTVEDFDKVFSEAELKEVTLKSLEGKVDNNTIYLRALSRATVTRFKNISLAIMDNRYADLLTSAVEESSEDALAYQAKLDSAEDFLIQRSICDSSGNLLFSNDKIFSDWREKIPQYVADEIAGHIKDMNYLSFEDYLQKSQAEKRKKK